MFDSQRFSQFAWLVVKEDVQLDGHPEARALPVLFSGVNHDFGRIEPHKQRIPAAVEAALFALLTVPWEDFVIYRKVEWRSFRIPWVYTIDDDVFSRTLPPPSPDTLSWEPAFYVDKKGEEIEDERPTKLPLTDGVENNLRWLNDDAFAEIIQARQSSLFSTPIVHFFVRAFLSEGIDEFLAHITAIEASLSLSIDHDTTKRKKLSGSKKQGATFRVSRRVSALLGSKAYGDDYEKLFKLRSEFLHGRPMGDISSDMRIDARSLARKVVCALVGAAKTAPQNSFREDYLGQLLDIGLTLT